MAAEVLALPNGCDIALWNKTLPVEMLTGKFPKELLEPAEGYILQTPFGLVPSIEEVQKELYSITSRYRANQTDGAGTIQDKQDKKNEIDSEARSKKIRSKLSDFETKYVDLLKLLVFADSSNAYDSILSGHPATAERTLRIQLSYVRDLSNLRCLSFIDKDYNIADSGAKTIGGEKRLLHIAMMYNAFKFGFLGRKEVGKFTNVRGNLKAVESTRANPTKCIDEGKTTNICN